MPLFWRHLFKQYMKVLTLAVVTFIAILFVSRLKTIAELAAVGARGRQVAAFALYLIPYVLPIALPIASLLASIVLFQRLSTNHELTAMRAGGLSLRQIVAPLLLSAAFLSLGNFYVASELATHCHMLGVRLEKQTANFNPLLLLQNTQLLRLGDVYVDMRTLTSGEKISDLTLFAYNRGTNRIQAFSADELNLKEGVLSGEGLNLLSTAAAQPTSFDHLLIENQTSMDTPSESFAHLLKQMSVHLKNSHLKLRLLLIRIAEDRAALHKAKELSLPTDKLLRQVNKGYVEVMRRGSLSLAVFTFTLMGCAFGIQVGRRPSKRGLLAAIGLATTFIAAFSLAGSSDKNLAIAASLLFLPQIAIISSSVWMLKRTTKGMAR